jgi:hypothetical protein
MNPSLPYRVVVYGEGGERAESEDFGAHYIQQAIELNPKAGVKRKIKQQSPNGKELAHQIFNGQRGMRAQFTRLIERHGRNR